MRSLILGLCLLASPAAATGLRITIEGEANGVVEIDLLEEIAPKAVEQIAALANEGFYDGVVFHRVIDGFMAQTGDGQYGNVANLDMGRAGTGDSQRPNLPAEFSEVPFDRGVVGMASLGDPRCRGQAGCVEGDEFLNSANAQFFIMFAEGHFLNGNYTVIGRVTSGMEVIDAIKLGEGRNGSVLGQPDVMADVEVID